MAMPNRQIVNGKPYRYAYQGQEKDPETGKEAFQLRIYDPRINRWLSPDPMGQYHSPYMSMDNTPNQSVDPTGGSTDCPKCPDPVINGPEVIINGKSDGGVTSTGIDWGWFNSLTSFRVDDLARQAGVKGSGIVFQRQVGNAFEKHALNSFSLSKNSIRFPAVGRAARGGRPTVVPDGVRNIKVIGSNGRVIVHPMSSFFEVKKRQGVISLKSDRYQTLGIIDAAATSSGGSVGRGSVTFITTSNTVIGQDVLKYAQKHGVHVYQSVAFEFRKSGRVTYSSAIRLTTSKTPSFPNPIMSWPTKLKF